MQLGDRKKRILQAIIEDYIETAEPVGSRTIAKKHIQDLSSATIRNEMADLEDLGYLRQPHTSAGRVPSDLGYRLYVDSLMERYKLTMLEMLHVREALEARLREFDDLLNEASAILSKMTNYTALALKPEVESVSVRSVQLVPVDTRRILVVAVTNEGTVKNRLMAIPEGISPMDAVTLSSMLTSKLTGLTFSGVDAGKAAELQKEAGRYGALIPPVLAYVAEVLGEADSAVRIDGAHNILNFPEYASVEKAREIFHFLDDKKQLHELIAPPASEGIQVIIGSENPLLQERHCSVVYCTYRAGRGLGRIGVIGPTRMDYPRVVSTLEVVLSHFNRAVNRIFYDDDKGGTE